MQLGDFQPLGLFNKATRYGLRTGLNAQQLSINDGHLPPPRSFPTALLVQLSQLRREGRSTQRFSGRIDTSLPEARPLYVASRSAAY
jgi:hypothetical protein